MHRIKIQSSIITIFGGAILPFAFAPFGYYWLAEISLLLLLFAWCRVTPRQAFWYGWLFGIAFFSCGVYWVYISIHHFGYAPVVLSVAIVALLVMFMALYLATQGYVLQQFYPNNNWTKFSLAFPASFVIFEWIRGWFLSGFPWLFLGYSHVDSPLRGFASILGVYGVSFFVAQTAGITFYLFYELFYGRKNKKICLGLILYAIALWIVGSELAKIDWTKQTGKEADISLIQGNVSLERKWNFNELQTILDSYITLTTKNFASKLIVWPESAIAYPDNALPYLKPLIIAAKKNRVTIISGIPLHDKKDGRDYNGIITLGVDSGQYYYKRQLVPFGEYLPLKPLLSWLRNFLLIPMSDFSSGAKDQPGLLIQGVWFAPFICYEIAYSDMVLEYLPKAGLMLTVCDDSWFGESIASAQHLEIARMRSLEAGRYQLLSTNTGITAIIDAKGRVIAKAPAFQESVLSAKIKILIDSTPWVSYGRYSWLPLFLNFLLWAWVFRGKQPRRK